MNSNFQSYKSTDTYFTEKQVIFVCVIALQYGVET